MIVTISLCVQLLARCIFAVVLASRQVLQQKYNKQVVAYIDL